MSIEIPDNSIVQLFDLESSVNWFDENEIFYSVAKNVPRNLKTMLASAKAVKDIFDGKKYCVIVESSNLSFLDKKTRLYITSELGKLYKAIAIVSPKPMSRAAGAIIYSTNRKIVPQKSFKTLEEAKEWLQIYL
jgi:hypothetical protein